MVKCSDFIRFGSKFQDTLIFPDAKRFSSRTRLVGQRHAGNWDVQLPEAMHDQKLSFGEEIDCTILTSEESHKFWTLTLETWPGDFNQITVNGIQINTGSTLAILCQASSFLCISKSGSRRKCYGPCATDFDGFVWPMRKDDAQALWRSKKACPFRLAVSQMCCSPSIKV